MQRPQRGPIRFAGGQLLTQDAERRILRADLWVHEDRIVAIQEPGQASEPDAERVVDCRGCVLLPGLIQPHTHLCQTLFRGEADGLPLLDWLSERIFLFEAAHDADSLYLSALLGGAELLLGGSTAILDMGTVQHTDAIFKAAAKLGLRASIGKAMMDRAKGMPFGLREDTESSLAESKRLAERWHGAESGRLQYVYSPRFALSSSPELIRASVDAAKAGNYRLHTHASENNEECQRVKHLFGDSNVSYLRSLGFYGPGAVVAHGVWLTTQEQRQIAADGTHLVHCPSSNLKLASGVARVPELLNMGINVALAADGAPCNNRLDAFQEMRLAGLIHNLRGGATAMSAQSVLDMATRHGAKAMGLDAEIGSLEVGKKADLSVLNLMKPHLQPARNLLSTVVYAASASDVRDVYVDGIERVRQGKIRGLSLKHLYPKAEAALQRILATLP